MPNLSAGYWTSEDLRGHGVARVGENVSVSRSCEIVGLENLEIGDHVRIDAFCSLIATGPIRLGSWIHIAGGCLLSGRGGITIEDFSGLSGGVMLYSASDDFLGRHMMGPMLPAKYTGVRTAPIRLCKHSGVGTGARILPGVTLGEGAVLAAMSLADRSLEPWTIHRGVPAEPVGRRSRKLLALADALLAEQGRAS